jgi:hypothetical protein
VLSAGGSLRSIRFGFHRLVTVLSANGRAVWPPSDKIRPDASGVDELKARLPASRGLSSAPTAKLGAKASDSSYTNTIDRPDNSGFTDTLAFEPAADRPPETPSSGVPDVFVHVTRPDARPRASRPRTITSGSRTFARPTTTAAPVTPPAKREVAAV